jgi:hypothetical protein
MVVETNGVELNYEIAGDGAVAVSATSRASIHDELDTSDPASEFGGESGCHRKTLNLKATFCGWPSGIQTSVCS